LLLSLIYCILNFLNSLHLMWQFCTFQNVYLSSVQLQLTHSCIFICFPSACSCYFTAVMFGESLPASGITVFWFWTEFHPAFNPYISNYFRNWFDITIYVLVFICMVTVFFDNLYKGIISIIIYSKSYKLH
jgi:hypothetical protein